MKILVTGANGYIGNHVVDLLIKKGHDVVACDINTNYINPNAHILQYDIFKNPIIENTYTLFGKPDVCLHLAWRDGFVHNSPKHMGDLSSHFIFLTNLIKNGLKQLAVMGTMHEVGYYVGKIDENTPCNPLSLYAIAKNALRQSMTLFCNQNSCKLQWLRGFYIYGDDFRNHSIFTKILEAAERGDKTFPFTSGKNQYDFVHINELVEQIVTVILQQEVDGIINCCTGTPKPLGEAVREFIEQHKLDIILDYGAFSERPYDSPCVYGDNAKIKQIMNNA